MALTQTIKTPAGVVLTYWRVMTLGIQMDNVKEQNNITILVGGWLDEKTFSAGKGQDLAKVFLYKEKNDANAKWGPLALKGLPPFDIAYILLSNEPEFIGATIIPDVDPPKVG